MDPNIERLRTLQKTLQAGLDQSRREWEDKKPGGRNAARAYGAAETALMKALAQIEIDLELEEKTAAVTAAS